MKVVLAYDGSACAKEAASVLRGLEFDGDLQLYAVTVTVEPLNTSPENIQPWRPEWEEQQKKWVAEHHAELKEMFRDRCPDVTTYHRHGNAAHEILNVADQVDADVIVLGALGHSMIERVFLGSVSDHVATHTKCSVLVVRPKEEGSSSTTFNKVLLAYDGSNACKETVAELGRVNWGSDAEVTVISVAQQFDYFLGEGYPTVAVDSEREVQEAMRGHCEYATKQLASSFKKADSKVAQAHHVGDTIARTAKELGSDLIVVADSGHSMIERFLLGSTSKFVLHHAPCSVWISRHHLNASESSRSASKEEVAG